MATISDPGKFKSAPLPQNKLAYRRAPMYAAQKDVTLGHSGDGKTFMETLESANSTASRSTIWH